MSRNLDISVVISLFNESMSIRPLYRQIKEVLSKIGKSYEIIFVDDGSRDNSFEILKSIHNKDRKVKVIQFRRNFGKSAALSAGFKITQGNTVITMDADLQDNPGEIPRFLSKIDEGYDLVSGWKFPRQDPLTRRMASKVFNRVTSFFTQVKIHDFNCGFKAYRKEVTQDIRIYGELYRYIPVFAHWKGYRVGEIKVKHHRRKYGRSKYGIERFARGFLDLFTIMFLTRYTRSPLHLFGSMGLLTFLLGLIINVYLAILWFKGFGIGHRPLLILGVLLMIIGVQFTSFGLLAEMITDTQSREGEQYVTKEILK